jgi:small-conductance mechanosensitive channel
VSEGDLIRKDELSSAVEARRELGPEYEDQVLTTFLEKVERRLQESGSERERALKRRRDHQKELILGSMGISVPLLAIAAIFAGLAGIIAVCAVLAVIAVAASRSS